MKGTKSGEFKEKRKGKEKQGHNTTRKERK